MPPRLPQLSTLSEHLVPIDPETDEPIHYYETAEQEERFQDWIKQAGNLYKDPIPILDSEKGALLSRLEESYSLNGRTVQVICKMAEM